MSLAQESLLKVQLDPEQNNTLRYMLAKSFIRGIPFGAFIAAMVLAITKVF